MILGLNLTDRLCKSVVKVAYSKIVNVKLQVLVNVGLKCGCRVRESTQQDTAFELRVPSPECSLIFVTSLHPNQVVGGPEVPLAAYSGSAQFFYNH